MRLLHRVNPWAIAILAIATYSLAAGSAFGLSTGNGGGQPPAQYNSPLPTLNSGQGSYEQSDNRGRIIVSPSSFPSIQPVSIPTPAQYNSTLPSYTNGNSVTPQYDTNGRAIIAPFTLSLPSPLPVTVQQTGSLSDAHNSIVTANTSQTLLSAATRSGFILQNTSSGDLWINLLGSSATSATPSFRVTSGSSFTTPPFFPSSGSFTIWGATANQTFSVVTW